MSIAATFLVPVVTELVERLWNKLTGDTTSDTSKQAIDAIVSRALGEVQPALDKLEEEFRLQAAQLELVIGLLGLADKANDVLDAFKVKGDFIQMGLPIEIVQEITDEDRAREQASWDSLVTPPPEGSSEK